MSGLTYREHVGRVICSRPARHRIVSPLPLDTFLSSLAIRRRVVGQQVVCKVGGEFLSSVFPLNEYLNETRTKFETDFGFRVGVLFLKENGPRTTFVRVITSAESFGNVDDGENYHSTMFRENGFSFDSFWLCRFAHFVRTPIISAVDFGDFTQRTYVYGYSK